MFLQRIVNVSQIVCIHIAEKIIIYNFVAVIPKAVGLDCQGNCVIIDHLIWCHKDQLMTTKAIHINCNYTCFKIRILWVSVLVDIDIVGLIMTEKWKAGD